MGGHFGMSAPGALYWPCKLDSAIKKPHLCGSKPRETRCLGRNHKRYTIAGYVNHKSIAPMRLKS